MKKNSSNFMNLQSQAIFAELSVSCPLNFYYLQAVSKVDKEVPRYNSRPFEELISRDFCT